MILRRDTDSAHAVVISFAAKVVDYVMYCDDAHWCYILKTWPTTMQDYFQERLTCISEELKAFEPDYNQQWSLFPPRFCICPCRCGPLKTRRPVVIIISCTRKGINRGKAFQKGSPLQKLQSVVEQALA